MGALYVTPDLFICASEQADITDVTLILDYLAHSSAPWMTDLPSADHLGIIAHTLRNPLTFSSLENIRSKIQRFTAPIT